MNNFIEFNKFSHLHDGKNIFFCKTDYLFSQFNEIKNIDSDIVLISGNSDYCITDRHVKKLPDNVKFWFTQNCLVDHEKIFPLPIGIENQSISALGKKHGISWGAGKKGILLTNVKQRKPTKLAYSNFRPHTGGAHRSTVKKICVESDHIEWHPSSLSTEKFYDQCLDYKLVICPQGNGQGDNHRIYETLYLKRVPVTFNEYMYKKLHHKFPVICLDDPNKLKDKQFLEEKLLELNSQKFNEEVLYCDWWIKLIKNKINEL